MHNDPAINDIFTDDTEANYFDYGDPAFGELDRDPSDPANQGANQRFLSFVDASDSMEPTARRP